MLTLELGPKKRMNTVLGEEVEAVPSRQKDITIVSSIGQERFVSLETLYHVRVSVVGESLDRSLEHR